MHWKLKAMIQNGLSLLPSTASYACYYWVQRHFGGLRRVDPMNKLSEGINTWKRIKAQGYNPTDKIFLEIGTGRVPLVPLSYWMMGAKKTITIDLNPYLKEDLLNESLLHILQNKEKIKSLFGSLIVESRLNKLLAFSKNTNISAQNFLDLCNIKYVAPGDAAKTNLPSLSIDFHTSYNVFEHIPEETLVKILAEGARIIKNDGLFIHRIDYSDHFSGTDDKISAINFLQYSDTKWTRYAGNRYMYMNRLRHDDFIHIYKSAGLDILSAQPTIDQRSKEQLSKKALKIDKRFSNKTDEILSITGSWIVSRKKGIRDTP